MNRKSRNMPENQRAKIARLLRDTTISMGTIAKRFDCCTDTVSRINITEKIRKYTGDDSSKWTVIVNGESVVRSWET